eukprot:jgi/Ulvmu1/10680/UM067_0004.1
MQLKRSLLMLMLAALATLGAVPAVHASQDRELMSPDITTDALVTGEADPGVHAAFAGELGGLTGSRHLLTYKKHNNYYKKPPPPKKHYVYVPKKQPPPPKKHYVYVPKKKPPPPTKHYVYVPKKQPPPKKYVPYKKAPGYSYAKAKASASTTASVGHH